jgi:hypothetical protein
MGHRANLIIVENNDYTLRYDHWVSNRLDDVLFWGADYALEYIEAQEIVGENGWLDDVWAEGGAVLDLDKKTLLWFGGEDVAWEVPLRNVFLELQKKIWSDWNIEWAFRGIVDITEYVGYEKEKVISPRVDETDARFLAFPEKFDWTDIIGAIIFADGSTKLFPLAGNVQEYLENGKNIIEQGRNLGGFENIVWTEISNDSFPAGGFIVDETQKIVEFWRAKDCSDIVNELKKVWDDWDVDWRLDNYSFQVEKLRGRLVLPQIDKLKMVDDLRQRLLREDHHYNIENVIGITSELEKEGKSVQINSWAYKSRKVKNPIQRKIDIWEKFIGNNNWRKDD